MIKNKLNKCFSINLGLIYKNKYAIFSYELDDEELELVIESIRNNEADIEKVS